VADYPDTEPYAGSCRVLPRRGSPRLRRYHPAATRAYLPESTADARYSRQQDPITLRSTLPAVAKEKIKAALLAFDFTTLPDDVQKMFTSDVGMEGTHLVLDDDSNFDQIRSLVSTLNIDLNSLS
jgi:hypothetical protein